MDCTGGRPYSVPTNVRSIGIYSRESCRSQVREIRNRSGTYVIHQLRPGHRAKVVVVIVGILPVIFPTGGAASARQGQKLFAPRMSQWARDLPIPAGISSQPRI